MKKTLLILGITLVTLSGCEKESLSDTSYTGANCGVITNDGITNGCYWLEIRNGNTGNKKTFCFDYDVWLNAHKGNSFCVTNQSQW